MAADTGDRRRSRRQRIAAYAALETMGECPNDQAFCVALNASRHGLALLTGQPPAVGEGLLLRLAIENEIHTLRVQARHVTRVPGGCYEVGLDWSNCTEQDIAFLDRYLTEMVAPGAPPAS